MSAVDGMSLLARDERVWFIHGPTGWTKFDREPGYAVRATGKIEILGPLVPADQLAGAVEAMRDLLEEAEDMRSYVPDYFAQKWKHDEALQRARDFLGGQ